LPPLKGDPVKISKVMNEEVIFVFKESTLSQAVDLMIKRRINGLPVIDSNHRVVGIITETDIIRNTDFFNPEQDRLDILQLLVCDVMTKNPISLTPDSDIEQAQAIFAATNIKQIPVTSDGALVGIVGIKDIIKEFMK
jgi:CBS domain-containing protein